MELRLHADRAGLHDQTPWVIVDWAQNPIQSGHGIATAPATSSVLVIVPDDCLYVITLSVPNLPEKRLILALPGLLEEQILVPPESAGFAILAKPEPGVVTVAVYYRAWFDSLMSSPVVARSRTARVVAESWALPKIQNAWSLHFSPDRFVLALPNRASCTGANDAGAAVPQHLLIALRASLPATDITTESPRTVSAPGVSALASVAVYCSSDLGDRMPAWLSELGLPVEERGVVDWIAAPYDDVPNLSGRRSLALPKARIIRAIKPAMVLAVLLCLVEFLFVATDWLILSIQRTQLVAQQASIFRATVGANAVLVNGESQMRRKLEAAQATAGQAAPSDLLALMTRLANEANTVPPLDELRYESGQLFLKAKGTDDEAAWMALARSAGLTATLDQREGKRSIKVSR